MGHGKLDPKREQYAQLRAKGLGKQAAAVSAGYADHSGAGAQAEESVEVAERIRELQTEAATNAGVTKEMVAEGLKAAAAIAQTQGDATGMVAAWKELGRMLGYYAPEVKKIQKSINQKDLRKALEDMSDEELLRLSRGRVIDGQFTRVSEQPASLPLLPEKPA